MPKRFIFRQADVSAHGMGGPVTVIQTTPRKFAEPTKEQIAKAKETWKRLAPKNARGLLK